MSILNDLSRPAEATNFNIQKKFSPTEICNAFKTTVTFMIADSFNLTGEETMWASYKIKEALHSLGTQKPKSLPNAVTHELLTRQYSTEVAKRKDGSYLTEGQSGNPADLHGWIDVIMEMVDSTYELDLMDEAETRAHLTFVLENLGVGGPANPRAALYLPNAVRWNAAQKRSQSVYGF